jgi:DNA-binding PadR family transcriptional regulator
LATFEVEEKPEESMLETKLLREMNKRIVKNLLDVIILVKLQERTAPLGGYDLMVLVHEESGVLISPGTVYACLYSMERDGLIEGKDARSKRGYSLTKKGENKIKKISEVKESILDSLAKIFI